MRDKKGFTLVEMIVTISVLTILAIAIIPLISNLIDKSRIARFIADSEAVRTAALSLQADIGTLDAAIFLADANIMNSTLAINATASGVLLGKWDGPYLERGVDTHPWGGIYAIAFANIDNSAPPSNNLAKTLDLILTASNIDDEGLATPIPQAVEIVTELNNKITGQVSGGNTIRAQISGAGDEVDLVVLSNVSQ